ncbi:hypothetical protein RND81_14G104600 [Saponaria officinalis]|uniref:Leucine-rich repeat-containing N-terminal plant-type domain-containing protein n=1 Tax=Saponaria officinalis TaxID=3572 RepID=A0AAW1GNT8_SAPOF
MTPYIPAKLHDRFVILVLIYAWLTYSSFRAISGTNNTHIEVRCMDTERNALLQFKNGIVVDRCGLLASWGGTLDCCQWNGIRCDNYTSHVISLHLSGFPTYNEHCLQGTISVSLSELNHLKYLNLGFNNFQEESIPEFIGSLADLEHLNLSNSGFWGVIPHEIGNLSRLSSLDLNCLNDTSCILRVDSLGWLSRLKSLRDVNLGGIDLSFVTDWVEIINFLPSLDVLLMDKCCLSIQSPSSLSYVNSSNTLRVVSLSGNRFLGTAMFNWLYNLTRVDTSLEYLDVSDSQISEEIPSFIWQMKSISHLDLSENGLSGEIPSEIGNMQNLKFLNLDYNLLSGPIPSEIWTLDKLSFLSVSLNRLQGLIPNTISNLKRLSHLDLSGNNVQLDIHALKALGKLCRLQMLRLDGINITSDFSQVIEYLSTCAHKSLVTLRLTDTQVSGSVPDSISRFSLLEILYVAGNRLNGTIGEGIGQLSRLKQLGLSSNDLNGVVSDSHFSNLTSLRILDLSDNPNLVFNLSVNWTPPFQLTDLVLRSSKVGPKFPKWVVTQKSIGYLDISDTGIRDTVPISFWHSLSSTLYYLNMSNNMIYGVLPDVSVTFQPVTQIYMSSNNLSGGIPSFLGYNVTKLDLSSNKLSHGLSQFLCPKTEMTLDFLDLSNNSFSDPLPDCWKYFPRLLILKLQNNNITGKLPSSIASVGLQALHLRYNKLSGELPKSWVDSARLNVLDLAYNSLTGYIPSTFVHGLQNLNILSLRNNKLSLGIPLSICRLSCLQILDLAGNNISGTLPNCLYNLTDMANTTRFTDACAFISDLLWLSEDVASFMWKRKERSFTDNSGLLKGIDISDNKLHGGIPDEILSLVGLVFLNLSQNNLSGPIPAGIGQLTSLEFLDLSHNRLSSEIPTSLASISYLEILDLSENNLSGRIPSGIQLQGFDASAYMGNPGLCGAPLSTCRGDKPIPVVQNGDNVAQQNEHNSDDDLFLGLYISVVLGVITGFWVVCGTLVLKRSWRLALFRFYDDINDLVVNTTRAFRRSLR